jgi:RNA polymerase sigma factor for flagellar operon FliA
MAIEAAEQELWRRYRTDGDPVARDYLFLRYLPWAKSVAAAVARRLRWGVLDWSDHVQNANVGLLEAMTRFDPDRGVDFIGYAKPRVRGAVFNAVRAAYRGVREVPVAASYSDRLESLGADSVDDELTAFVDTVVGLGLGAMLEMAEISSNDASPFEHYADLLRDALIDLPDRQREILLKHYFMQVQFQEIAQAMSVTKGRVSQLHKAALGSLRQALRKRRYDRDSFF